MRRRNARLTMLGLGAGALFLALAIAVVGLRDAVAFFRTPTEVLQSPPPPGRSISLGGLVAMGSVSQGEGAIVFRLRDDESDMLVRYSGPIPDLFREGQCVIAQGVVGPDGVFAARRVLARHDETYQPREIEAAPRLAESCGRAIAS